MISAVFDTNIFFQGILFENGPAGECVKLVDRGGVQLFFTQQTFDEIQDVISRPALIRKYPVLSSKRAEIILRSAAAQSIFVSDVPAVFFLDRDIDDQLFVNLAIAAKAHYIVTRDRDLLDLRDDSEFCNTFHELRIVTPVGFLEIVRAA
ncbi:MAG: putative toxin-antitoxin system toxin component, PIN family [Pyrinomonadaceae bacterium]